MFYVLYSRYGLSKTDLIARAPLSSLTLCPQLLFKGNYHMLSTNYVCFELATVTFWPAEHVCWCKWGESSTHWGWDIHNNASHGRTKDSQMTSTWHLISTDIYLANDDNWWSGFILHMLGHTFGQSWKNRLYHSSPRVPRMPLSDESESC
jgi:hypothetical protein